MSNEFVYPEVDQFEKVKALIEVSKEIGSEKVDLLLQLEERFKTCFTQLNSNGGIVTYKEFQLKVMELTLKSIVKESLNVCNENDFMETSISILTRVLTRLESNGILEFLKK